MHLGKEIGLDCLHTKGFLPFSQTAELQGKELSSCLSDFTARAVCLNQECPGLWRAFYLFPFPFRVRWWVGVFCSKLHIPLNRQSHGAFP